MSDTNFPPEGSFKPPSFLNAFEDKKKLDLPKLEPKLVSTTGNNTTEGNLRDAQVRTDSLPENQVVTPPPTFPDVSVNFAPEEDNVSRTPSLEASDILNKEFGGLEGNVPINHRYWKIKWNLSKQ